MTFGDWLAQAASRAEYALGTAWARLQCRSVGRNAAIHRTVRYSNPSQILIGDNCEIGAYTCLDGRGQGSIAISVGSFSRIKDQVAIAAYGGYVCLGQRVLIGRGTTLFGHGGIEIGVGTMIGPSSLIVSSNHIAALAGTPFQDQGFTREKITIGNNVWIGGSTCILAGTTIEQNVVIAAGSVVNGIAETGWIYGGIPARKLKELATDPPANTEIFYRDWTLFA